MKIYLAGGFSILNKEGRQEELLSLTDYKTCRLVSYAFKNLAVKLIELKRRLNEGGRYS